MAIYDSGSNYNFFDRAETAHNPTSVFDLSYLHTFDTDFGVLRPFYLQPTYAGDTFTLSNEILVESVPLSVRLKSRVRIFTHYYYMPKAHLWRHYQSYRSRGRNGDYSVVPPYCGPNFFTKYFPTISSSNPVFNHSMYDSGIYSGIAAAPFSPLIVFSRLDEVSSSYVGESNIWSTCGLLQAMYGLYTNCNIYSPPRSIPDDSPYVASHISVMPFMMYQRIYRDYYMDVNIQGMASSDGVPGAVNKFWFPDDDHDFMIHTDGLHDTVLRDQFSDGTGGGIALSAMRFRCWTPDYFTSARPWPQRGEAPTLDMSLDTSQLGIKLSSGSALGVAGIGMKSDGSMYPNMRATSASAFDLYNASSSNQYPIGVGIPPSELSKVSVTGSSISLGFTAAQFRELMINQTLLEKMANTDGSYREYMKAMFGVYPASGDDLRPIYIGGTYQPLVLSEVLQTSETGSTPLGERAGEGMSVSSGYVGKFHATEDGYIMGIMSIVPDTMYCQGIDRQFTQMSEADEFLPLRAKLGPQAILQKELCVNPLDNSGNGVSANSLFAYQDRFDEMRYRQNLVSGSLADPSQADRVAQTQVRIFGSAPTLSSAFITMNSNTIQDDAWTSPADVCKFTVQVANKCRCVRQLPYRSIPASLVGV